MNFIMQQTKMQTKVIKKYKLMNNQRITIQELTRIANLENMEIQDLIFILGCYRNAKYKEENNWTRVNFNKKYNKREQVKMIKIDLKYIKKYGSRLYTKKEIEDICKIYGIEVDDFLTYLYNYKICYYENVDILTNNEKGIWIGDYPELSNEFLNKYYIILKRQLEKIAQNMINIYSPRREKEDLIDIGLNYMLKHGEIEQNLKFDEDRAIKKLLYKARYKILENIIKSFQESDFDKMITYVGRNAEFEQEDGVSQWMYSIHLKKIQRIILDYIQRNIEEVLENRQLGLRRIYKRLNLSCKKFYQNLEEIRMILIENKKVRICKDGKVIIVNE